MRHERAVLTLQVRSRPLDLVLVQQVTSTLGAGRLHDSSVHVWSPAVPELIEPVGLRAPVLQVAVRGAGQVLQHHLFLGSGRLEENLGARRQRVRVEGHHRPVDFGVPLEDALDQRVVPVDVPVQRVLPGPVGLQDHVQEVCGVRYGVQDAVQGVVGGDVQAASKAAQLVPPGAVDMRQRGGVPGVQESGHHPRQVLLDFVRHHGALRGWYRVVGWVVGRLPLDVLGAEDRRALLVSVAVRPLHIAVVRAQNQPRVQKQRDDQESHVGPLHGRTEESGDTWQSAANITRAALLLLLPHGTTDTLENQRMSSASHTWSSWRRWWLLTSLHLFFLAGENALSLLFFYSVRVCVCV